MQLFDVFPRNELPLAFLFTVGIRWFIGLLGFFLNFSLVYVTWKTKTFRQMCNCLLAANAFFSGLFGLSLSIGLAFVFRGHPFMFEGPCVVFQTFPLLCRNFGLSLLFWVGFDRLINSLFANSFFHRHQSFYLFLIIAGSSLHSGFILISVFKMAIDYPNHVTICLTHDDTYVGTLSLLLFMINVALSALIFFVYVALAIVIKFKNDTSVSYQITRRLLRSLMAIMIMVVAGFALNNLVNVFFQVMAIKLTEITQAYTAMALSCLTATAYASNAPLLIIFSTEYRKEYLRTFGPILKQFHLISNTNSNSTQNSLKNQQTKNNNNNNRIVVLANKSQRNLAKVTPLAN